MRDPSRSQSGAALLLVLLVTVLLYAMVWELVRISQTARITGENDLLLARMRRHMTYTEAQVEEMLLADLEAAAAGEEGGAGGLGGALAGAAPGAAGAAPSEEEAPPDPSTIADGSQDAWYEPSGYSENDLTTYVWIEDENRKFNLLALVSPDEEFRDQSKHRLSRLIDVLREGTLFDVTQSDADMITQSIDDWLNGRGRTEMLPRPELKSDEEGRPDITLPLHLDELLLMPGVDSQLFFDKVIDGRTYYGLESCLTVWTAMAYDPGDPNDPPSAANPADPGGTPAAPGTGTPAPGTGTPAAGGTPAPPAPGEPAEPLEPIGVGIRININTAPRPVLRCLFAAAEMPDSVIDAILRFRNEEEEDLEKDLGAATEDYTLYVQEGETPKRKMFTDLEQLEDLPEFANLPDPDLKAKFKELLSITSDVFSVHYASVFKRNEEARSFVLQRARSVLMRVEGEEPKIHPLIFVEQRHGLRVTGVDFPDDENLLDSSTKFDQLDAFSQEERAWNPFFVDFYRPAHEREELFTYRDRMK